MQAISTQTFLTDVAAAPARVLSYEPRGASRSRLSLHTRWAKAATAAAALTFAYTAACTAGLFLATGWDQLAWLVWGFIGNWIGSGLGFLLALVGCVQRSRRRALAVRALWVNLAVAAVPVIGVLVPFWLS